MNDFYLVMLFSIIFSIILLYVICPLVAFLLDKFIDFKIK